MKFYYLIDLILICAAMGIVLRCWKTGLVSSVIRLVGAVASYAGAWLFSEPIAQTLYHKYLQARLVDYAGTLVPPDLQKLADSFVAMGGNSGTLDSLGTLGLVDIPGMISQKLTEILTELGLGDLPFNLVDTDKMGQGISGFVLEKGYTIAEALTEVLFQPLATAVLRVCVFAVIFGLLSLLVGILYRIGFGFNRLPLVGGINHLLGAGVGLLEAAIVVYILCMVLAMVSTVLGSRFPFLGWNELRNTLLYSRIIGVQLPGGFGLL